MKPDRHRSRSGRANGDRSTRSFLWLTWSGIANIASSMLIWIVIARMRTPEEVGRFSIVMGLYALLFTVVSLGLVPYLINEIGRRLTGGSERARSLPLFIGSAAVLMLVSGLESALIMTAGGYAVSLSPDVHAATAAMSLALVPTGLIALAEATAIAEGRTGTVAAVTTVENVLKTVIPIGLILSGADLATISLSYALVRFVALLIYLVVERATVVRARFSGDEFRRLASTSVTFAATVVFASINWQAAIVLLGYFGPEAEAAKFGVASRFLIPVTILMSGYSSAIQPELARRMHHAPEEMARYLASRARLPVLVALAAGIASPFLSRPVLVLLFGEGYAQADAVLEMLALSAIPFCLVIIAARGLIALERQRVDLLANIAGTMICVGIAIAAIPTYGAVGAAAAQLLAFIVMAAIEVVYFVRKVRLRRLWQPASV
jgi:O-antigen/teichoic acid export membrane protein